MWILLFDVSQNETKETIHTETSAQQTNTEAINKAKKEIKGGRKEVLKKRYTHTHIYIWLCQNAAAKLEAK